MARQLFLSVLMIVVVCWSGQYVDGQGDGVRFSLNDTTYWNNSLVTLENIGSTNDDALLCLTDLAACCRSPQTGQHGPAIGHWYFPNRTIVPNMADEWDFYRTRGPSVLRMIRRRNGVMGIYRCEIPVSADPSREYKNIYIGVYTTNSGSPTVTSLTFNSSSNTLTCTSNGGPVTNVTWRKDGAMITPNATYQQTKRVVDLVAGTYQTVLTIDPSVGQSDIVGTYNCKVKNSREESSRTVVLTAIPPPTVSVGVSPPGTVPYAGNNLTLSCTIVLTGGITNSDVMVTSRWTKDGAMFSGIPGRVTFPDEQMQTTMVFIRRVAFSPLSSSIDNDTYACVVTLISIRPEFVNAASRSDSVSLAVRVPTITVALTANTTRLPNVAPYNTFSLTCTATSSVEGVGNVALPKRFQWLRQYGSSEMDLVLLSDNATVQIQDGDNLNQPTSSSMLTVTEDAPHNYRYRCRVDLDLTNDMISNRMDINSITVTGPSSPLQPLNLMSTSVRHNTAIVHWTVPRIAYTPENYTVHFGTSSGSLTPFNQQQQSGDNFTATNLQFSLQLTGLSAGTTYYYQVVAVNSVGSTASVEQSFTTTELSPGPPQMFQITSVTTTSISFSWQAPAVLNGVLTGYRLTCQPELPTGIPSPSILSPGPTVNTAELPDLFPGVRYNCSIAARNRAGPSDPVHAVDTTNETAPTGPPQSFIVTPGVRNMTFSWSLPAPTLRNGVITGYSLSCVPEGGGGNSISMQYTTVGTFTLGGFTPATSYDCSISANNSQGSGPVSSMISTTLEAPPDAPPQNFVFSVIDDVPEMIEFFWEPPLQSQQNGVITGYNIVCTSGTVSLTFMTDDVMSDILNATVGIFIPATEYSCAITASTSAGPGPAETRIILTLPASPDNVTLTTTSSPLRVTWTIDPPDGLVSSYTIYVTRLERGRTVVNYTSTNTQLLQFDVPNLDPYELVKVNVSASNSAGEGPSSPGVRGRTREESPGIVNNCPSRWTDMPSAIQVTWNAPEIPNGMILQYHLQLTTYDDRTVIATESVQSSTLLGQLDSSELQDGVPYIVSIFAENSAGNGTKCNVTDFTNELRPPPPSNVTATRINGTTLSVSWQPLSLVDARGHITYHVMVTPTSGSRRRRQATQGERVCTLSSPCEVPANESSAIVGGLDQDTSYSVTVNAVNSEGEVGPTSMSITPTIPSTGPPPSNLIPIIAGVVVAVAIGLIIVIVIIIIVVYRMTHSKKAQYEPPSNIGMKMEDFTDDNQATLVHSTSKGFMHSEEDLATFEPSEHVQTSGATEHQVMDRLKSVPVAAFSAHVRSMHQDRDKGFEQEYQSISNDAVATSNVAKLSYNKAKNRFANIFPYDFARVKLQEIEGVEGSDYVNASYIDGYNYPNAYIAAQGPMPHTVSDFWQMIWEHKLVTVVMLTKCTEAGKRKCEQYWSDNVNDTFDAGSLVVTLTDLVPYADYEIKRFSIKDTSKPDTPPLNVTHYHFLGWPDHGVPKFATSLIAFIRRVRKSHKKDGPPMLVHCSAGVGRTGTFILLDSMLERMKAEDTVNVYEFLRNMRAKRVFMVQTLAQYVFIHDALEELITCGETDISAGNLRVKVNKLHKIIPSKAISGFEDQFKLLDSVSRKANAAECSDALQHYNKHKNRYDDRVPYNLSRTRLRPTGVTGAEYINASFVDGYKLRNAYIAAQAPLQETVNDFWRMIWEFKSKAIVMLCNFEESGQEACYPFWPARQGEPETYGKLLVTLQEEEPGKEYTVRKFEIKDEKPQTPNQNQILSFVVTLFHYPGWPEHDSPSSTTTVLKLIEEVNKVQRSTGNRPITIMCNDGMGRTGTFLCIHAQLERVKSEGLVDFFQFVKSSRIHRPSIISDKEQYIFCHESLADYLDSFDTYANFKEL